MSKPPFWLACMLVAGHASAAGFTEDFGSDPAARGWRVFGAAGLFHWNVTEQNLEVTWDSAQSNSYYCRPLRTILTKADDFGLSFDLRLDEITVGLRPGKPFTFQVAVGLLNFREATGTNFLRGTAAQSPDLVEFDYFADSGFGATISPVMVSSDNQFIPSFSFPLELAPGEVYHVEMTYTAGEERLTTRMRRRDEPFGPIKDVNLPESFMDFRVDTVAVSSFSDDGAGGSILARGVVDNITVELPKPPIAAHRGSLAGSVWQAEFVGQTNWIYTLERSEDLRSWSATSDSAPGTGSRQILAETPARPPLVRAFYRVRAERR